MIDWKTISLKDLGGFVSEALRKNQIDAVLVGGACAVFYTNNRHVSYDLDYVTYADIHTVDKTLLALGLKKKNRYYYLPHCSLFIEFVSPPVAIGSEPITGYYYIETKLGTIKLLRPADSVKDRLASYYHWGDKEAKKKEISIWKQQDINLEEVKQWSIKERCSSKFEEFLSALESFP